MDKTGSKDDSEIVEACIEGDLTAWESLAAKYSDLIRAAINNRIRKFGMSLPVQDIEDICQDVLISMWTGRKLEEIKNRVNISYWLAIVSGNAAAQYLRRVKTAGMDKMVPLQDAADEESEIHDIAQAEEAVPADPEEGKIPDEIKNALRYLQKKEKLVMKLLIFHDKKYGEIAEILNMPKGTVSSYVKRARVKLKKILK